MESAIMNRQVILKSRPAGIAQAENFQIVKPGKTHELHAPDHQEMMAWLHALKENLAVLRNRVTAF